MHYSFIVFFVPYSSYFILYIKSHCPIPDLGHEVYIGSRGWENWKFSPTFPGQTSEWEQSIGWYQKSGKTKGLFEYFFSSCAITVKICNVIGAFPYNDIAWRTPNPYPSPYIWKIRIRVCYFFPITTSFRGALILRWPILTMRGISNP